MSNNIKYIHKKQRNPRKQTQGNNKYSKKQTKSDRKKIYY